jgi:hypothetical protein
MQQSPSLLHVGCGGETLPGWLGKFHETRLDINPANNPDIVRDMRNLDGVGTYDAIYCSHALEHLSPHEVVPALVGFHSALNPDGVAIIFVPDLEGVQATDEVLFNSPAGPICGMDLIYGYRPALAENPYMAHKTGFDSASLHVVMVAAGFADVRISRLSDYALIGAGKK